MSNTVTTSVLEEAPLAWWRSHLFGLPPDRWAALAGRRFWVTGGGTGFGRAVALALAAAGARVVVTGRRRSRLEECAAEAESLGLPGGIEPLPADLTDAAGLGGIRERLEEADLHGLVHCAAVPPPRRPFPLLSGTLEEWDLVIRTNVTAAWLAARTALPILIRSGGGRVILLTSAAGWSFAAGAGPYNVSKAAVNSLAACLAAEAEAAHPGADVTVNALDPGQARTEMNAGSTESPTSAACMTLAILSHPLGGPNGRLFHRDGAHLAFCCAAPWPDPLLASPES